MNIGSWAFREGSDLRAGFLMFLLTGFIVKKFVIHEGNGLRTRRYYQTLKVEPQVQIRRPSQEWIEELSFYEWQRLAEVEPSYKYTYSVTANFSPIQARGPPPKVNWLPHAPGIKLEAFGGEIHLSGLKKGYQLYRTKIARPPTWTLSHLLPICLWTDWPAWEEWGLNPLWKCCAHWY